MNKAFLIGRLGKDPELKTTQSGISVCTFPLAVDDPFNKDKDAQWFNIVCWRKTAEFAAKYFFKGRKVAVEGRLQTRSYDAQDGSKRYITEIVADNIEFCDSKPEGGAQPRDTVSPSGDFSEVPDDELPF